MKDDLTILGTVIKAGSSHRLNFNKAKLYNATNVEVPVIIERSKKSGPVILIMAGLHGDEVNGIEVVRQIIARKFNKPSSGTIICMPILNIFGFLDMKREFPDGRDLNRSFPGFKKGSLAGRFAYQFVNEILPHVDIVLDFHTGGAHRFNAPQLRIESDAVKANELAQIFNPPFLITSKRVKGTLRDTCSRLGKPYLLYEGGKSGLSDKHIIKEAVDGTLRVLHSLGVIDKKITVPTIDRTIVLVAKSKWVRASHSGMLHPKVACGKKVEKGEFIATITDPYGSFRYKILAPFDGYVINVNHSPMAYQGDAIFHIAKHD